jgi:hypothetical protein
MDDQLCECATDRKAEADPELVSADQQEKGYDRKHNGQADHQVLTRRCQTGTRPCDL